jgi:hypothetical protein
VRKEDFNDPRFPVVKVPGVDGDVITCGDLILFEQPETIFARRRAKAVERKRREMEELRHGATEQIKEDAKRMGINMDGGLTQSIGGFGQNYHEMEANVEVEAQEELMSGRTSTQFGGFRGNPQYNKLKLSGDSRLNVAEQV